MIKGKTEIILTDVYTGESQKILEQNMVTNALNDIFKQEGYMKSANEMYGSNFQPPYSTLLGGILLFDKILEEDTTKYFAPGGTNLTACGVYGVKNTTTDELRGDYNSDESYLDTNAKTMKYVYDFPTSKGNGIIASVCLTSAKGGYSSYGSTVNGGTNQLSNFFIPTGSRNQMASVSGETTLAIDSNNDIVYTAVPTTVNSRLVSLTVRKRRAYMKTLSVIFSAASAGLTLESKEVAVDSIYRSYGWNYDKTTNTTYFYSGVSDRTVANGNTFLVIALPLDTLVTKTYTITNNSGVSLDAEHAYVYNGYAYMPVYGDYKKAYKISLINNSDITLITAVESIFSRLTFSFALGDTIFVPGVNCSSYNYKAYAIDTVANTAKPTQSYISYSDYNHISTRFIPVIGSNITMARCYTTDSVGFNIPCNYLATINNLSTPVTKAETQTMKVIYTITESDI